MTTRTTEPDTTTESGPMKSLRKQLEAAEARATRSETALVRAHVQMAGGDPEGFLGKQIGKAFLDRDDTDDLTFETFEAYAKKEGVAFDSTPPTTEETPPVTADTTGGLGKLGTLDQAAQSVADGNDEAAKIQNRLKELDGKTGKLVQTEVITLQGQLAALRRGEQQ